MRSPYRIALAVLLLACPASQARFPADLDADGLINAYLRRQTVQTNTRYLDGAKTLKEWQDRLPRLRQQYLDMLGLWPLPEKTPLKAAVTGTVEHEGVVIEKVHFQSRPGLYVTGNLYRAKKAAGKLPGILYVCGHSNRGRDGNKTAFQDHGMWFARHGYVCLIVDTLQLGEVAGKHHGTYNLGRMWWHSAGYTPAGVEAWNGIRALDYLSSRPEVDADKLGVTGISGGGASTVWIAAADERVKVAVPVSGMSDLESYVSNKVINGHCDCMFVTNLYGWEWTTLAALIAPRPMLFANSDNDPIFPMDGNRRIIARLREVYKLHGKPDLVDDFVSKGGHDYRKDLRLAIFGWFHKHLKGEKASLEDATDPPLPGKQLRVFAEDKDLPADAVNASIDETFIPRAKVGVPEPTKFADWKKGLMAGLRERPFHAFPQRVDVPRVAGSEKREVGNGQELVTEAGVQVLLSGVVKKGKEGSTEGVLIVLNEEDEARMQVPQWAEGLVGDAEVRLLIPRGSGDRRWTRKSPPNYVERAHALLGRTVDEGRVLDVAAAVRFLSADGKKTWTVAGKGRAGVVGAYAGLFEPEVKGVIAVQPPASHRDGPHFLGVLRVLDVPEALGLLTPRPLVLVGAKDKGFEKTAAVYKVGGGKLEQR